MKITPAEFEQWYTEYYPGVKGYIKKRIRDEHAAEDIAQEVFMTFMKHVDPARNPLGYLYIIAKTQIVDYVRRKKANFPFVTNYPEVGTKVVHPDTTFMLDEYGISPEMKLRAQGYRGKEIAKILELDHGTVRSRLHAQRQQLKERLDR